MREDGNRPADIPIELRRLFGEAMVSLVVPLSACRQPPAEDDNLSISRRKEPKLLDSRAAARILRSVPCGVGALGRSGLQRLHIVLVEWNER